MGEMYGGYPDGGQNPMDGDPCGWEGEPGRCVAETSRGRRCSRGGNLYFGYHGDARDDGPFCHQHEEAEPVFQGEGAEPHPGPPACVNCDNSLQPAGSLLFCSELCQQEASYVRYHRRVLRDGRIEQPDIREAVETQRALILGGGYPERRRRLTPEARAAVLARDRGRCRRCGAPATSVDHIGAPIDGDINHPDNLQALCVACHNLKTRGQFVRMTPESHPEEWARAEALEVRVLARRSVRPCDDEQNWETAWRRLAAERKAAAPRGAP